MANSSRPSIVDQPIRKCPSGAFCTRGCEGDGCQRLLEAALSAAEAAPGPGADNVFLAARHHVDAIRRHAAKGDALSVTAVAWGRDDAIGDYVEYHVAGDLPRCTAHEFDTPDGRAAIVNDVNGNLTIAPVPARNDFRATRLPDGKWRVAVGSTITYAKPAAAAAAADRSRVEFLSWDAGADAERERVRLALYPFLGRRAAAARGELDEAFASIEAETCSVDADGGVIGSIGVELENGHWYVVSRSGCHRPYTDEEVLGMGGHQALAAFHNAIAERDRGVDLLRRYTVFLNGHRHARPDEPGFFCAALGEHVHGLLCLLEAGRDPGRWGKFEGDRFVPNESTRCKGMGADQLFRRFMSALWHRAGRDFGKDFMRQVFNRPAAVIPLAEHRLG